MYLGIAAAVDLADATTVRAAPAMSFKLTV